VSDKPLSSIIFLFALWSTYVILKYRRARSVMTHDKHNKRKGGAMRRDRKERMGGSGGGDRRQSSPSLRSTEYSL